jgi:hypothetical protein
MHSDHHPGQFTATVSYLIIDGAAKACQRIAGLAPAGTAILQGITLFEPRTK